MLTLTRRLPPDSNQLISLTLSLTAEERTRSRHSFLTESGERVYVQLPRGTVLQHNDLLMAADGSIVQIQAKAEPVLTVTAPTLLDLLRAAYHLGNRHVPLEVSETYLRLAPDPVLKAMLQQLGVEVCEEICPFQPETGAYGSGHAHQH